VASFEKQAATWLMLITVWSLRKLGDSKNN